MNKMECQQLMLELLLTSALSASPQQHAFPPVTHPTPKSTQVDSALPQVASGQCLPHEPPQNGAVPKTSPPVTPLEAQKAGHEDTGAGVGVEALSAAGSGSNAQLSHSSEGDWLVCPSSQ
mmetsp:Transcript_120012/g.224355  ORF Transcript_120012/g.224355 Transcript_120012/m.224355 type:complete len:120 (+) Transcript_120012:210-569(+)